MEMVWYVELSSDLRRRFIDYLNKVCRLKLFDGPEQVRQKEMIRDLIIPTLTEGEGFIPEDMDRIQQLAHHWDMTNGQLAQEIYQRWKKMNKPLNAQAAARLVNRSANTLRRWARQGVIHADIDKKGHWVFTREVLIDKMH